MNKFRYPYYFLFILTFLSVQDFALSLTTSDKILSYGYPLKIYQFETEDNAIVGMARIPHGKKFNGTIGRPVIFMGALLSGSFPYVIRNDALVFSLADAGFDIWLPDYRAMGLSKDAINPKTGKKIELSQINWDFSIHELGVYDFPAAIDFVLNHTKHSKVDVVEVSLGTTIVLIGLSERPEYNAKIRNNIMIAPAARYEHSLGQRPFQVMSARIFFPIFIRYLKMFKYATFAHDPDNNALGRLCRNVIMRYQCVIAMIILQGRLTPISYKYIADLSSTYPQPTSTKYMIHAMQLMKSGRFQNYDYGSAGNKKHYNSKIVPEYDIKKVTAPSIIIYSKTDLVSAVEDVQWLIDNMPNIKDIYFIKNVTMSHQGFLLGKKSPVVIYPYVVNKLLKDD